MQDDFDKLNEIFGVAADKDREVDESAPELKKNPLRKLDEKLYDPATHGGEDERDEDDEERDYRPIRSRRDGRVGCLGGVMYFVFVISLSIIIACLGWMAATDVLALNKEETEAEITLPESIFTQETVTTTDADGKTVTKTVSKADIGYVATALKDAGIIQYKTLFRFFCAMSSADEKLDPGTYELNTNYDYRALVKKMQTGGGAAVTIYLTFPEGWTMYQVFAYLEENGVSSSEDLYEAAAGYIYNYSFIDSSGESDASRLEGYLFPDTYQFYVGMQASSAVNIFLQNFNGKITADMYNQAENLGRSLDEIITIASMVEKEAANDDERANIAGVIYNRLAAGMALAIDATSLYSYPEHEGAPTGEMLQDAGDPYNTRLNTGLTPTPICNPGLASIRSALQPAEHSYYYYALNMETMTHEFFETLDEFNAFTVTQDYGSLG